MSKLKPIACPLQSDIRQAAQRVGLTSNHANGSYITTY
jgi:hypothetical protein